MYTLWVPRKHTSRWKHSRVLAGTRPWRRSWNSSRGISVHMEGGPPGVSWEAWGQRIRRTNYGDIDIGVKSGWRLSSSCYMGSITSGEPTTSYCV